MNNDIKVVVARPEWYKYRKFALCWNLLENKTEKDANADFIFNRCISPDKRHYLFMKNLLKKIRKTIGILNNPFVEEVCNDKYLTYTFLKRYAPKTFLSLKYIHSAGKHLAVIKPRYGAAGKGVKIKKAKLIKNLEKDFILQEFIDTSYGIKNVVGGVHDFRIVMINNKMMDFYIRVPRKGLISNISLGGRMLRTSKIPRRIIRVGRYVDKKFKRFKPRIYSIDFLVDKNQKPWIVEMNSHPTLDVYHEIGGCQNYQIYEKICKELISSIKPHL